jgi:hypothetical protein
VPGNGISIGGDCIPIRFGLGNATLTGFQMKALIPKRRSWFGEFRRFHQAIQEVRNGWLQRRVRVLAPIVGSRTTEPIAHSDAGFGIRGHIIVRGAFSNDELDFGEDSANVVEGVCWTVSPSRVHNTLVRDSVHLRNTIAT